MSLTLYNSLSGKLEEFKPLYKNSVYMYVCGPTVYNYIHIGNARPVVFYDMLRNYLTFLGYKVKYVSNITDVDDKIIKQAISENKSEKEIATFYESAYFEACRLLGSKKPDVVPHATDYIEDMIDFIGKLLALGYAYEVDGDVYFRVGKIADYGCLSKQVSQDLDSGARISVNEKKENPLDFALWKKTDLGIRWDSPFGEGRPGWHTECVVMNFKIFGRRIDIHGGGMDLKFPHHENEIAQSEALFQHHLAKYWVHVGRLEFEGQKMSKSLKNVILVNDLANTKAGMVMRMVLVFTPYRNNFSYSQAVYDSYEKTFDKWQRTYRQAQIELQLANILEGKADESDLATFKQYMDQDLNVQNVMMLIENIIKELNVAIRCKELSVVSAKYQSLKTILSVLGVDLFVDLLDEEQLDIFKKWLDARENKNFELADKYRRQLVEFNLL